jgi:hypothetical protein
MAENNLVELHAKPLANDANRISCCSPNASRWIGSSFERNVLCQSLGIAPRRPGSADESASGATQKWRGRMLVTNPLRTLPDPLVQKHDSTQIDCLVHQRSRDVYHNHLRDGSQPDGPIPTPAEAVSGSWSVDGNGFVSLLEFKIGEDGKVEGTIYGHPLEGKYDAATKTLSFKRMQTGRTGVQTPVQEWTGTFAKGKKPCSSTLSGTFKSVAGANWGKEDFEYTWNVVRFFTAEVELKDMQGLWVLKSHTPLPLGMPPVRHSRNSFAASGAIGPSSASTAIA